MPVVLSNPAYPSQVGPNGNQAYVQQLSFRQMINTVGMWNPNVDPMEVARLLNNHYRTIIGKRDWYALKVRGNINIPTVTTQGTCTITNGSNTVQGIGTNWQPNLIGFQFRAGFTFPWATIVNVNPVTQMLVIDTPFGGVTQTGGYQVQSVYITLGSNITMLKWAVNQQQGWPMDVNVPVETLNVWDPWRQSLGWSTIFATRPPTPDGQFQVEVWPVPFQAQVFPFEAYIQPPDMQADSDSPASFIPADLIVTRAIADVKLMGGRTDKYYDPQVASMKLMEYKERLEDAENRDNALDQQDVTWNYGHENGEVGFGPGNVYAQSHDV